MKSFLYVLSVLFSLQLNYGQNEKDQIKKVIESYAIGTAYNYPEKIKSAFLPKANMFLDHNEKPLFVMTVEEYAAHIAKHSEPGKFNGRTTNILSIDRFGEIATAKLEVIVPSMEMRFIDFLLLKKLEDGWKIIQQNCGK